jgi:hypothetical protein
MASIVADALILPHGANRTDRIFGNDSGFGHGGFLLLTWLRLATSSSARFGGRQPLLNCAKHSLRHQIKIGNTMAYSCPASRYGTIGKSDFMRMVQNLSWTEPVLLSRRSPQYASDHRD